MQGLQLIKQYTKRWRLLRVLEAVLYGLGMGIAVGLVFASLLYALLAGIGTLGIALLFIQPWGIDVETVTRFVDAKLYSAEYSTALITTAAQELSPLAQLQQQKIAHQLGADLATLSPKTGLKNASIWAISFAVIGFLASVLISQNHPNNSVTSDKEVVMALQSVDTLDTPFTPPTLTAQKLTVRYPDYTRVPTRTSSEMSAKVVEGSVLRWNLVFQGRVQEVFWEGLGSVKKMKVSESAFAKAAPNSSQLAGQQTATLRLQPETSGYYNFRFIDSLGAAYTSEIYAIQVLPDQAPEVIIKDLAQFTSFHYYDTKALELTAELSDDYGLGTAQIIATVSQGTGESVKFREEQIAFDQPLQTGSKKQQLRKKINLDQLNMEVGDELYFYVETKDQKTPRANVARSETYFAVIKDTVSDGFGVEGTMGVDLMPDYFRSQRQLIIDTEKLIKDRPAISEQAFKSRSNELGFDQKTLRLKYGQFMGDEADSGIDVTPDIDEDDFDADDPTAGFRHDHDSDNEHNLVEEEGHDHHDHEEHSDTEASPAETKESLLEDYLHNHDDPEESTLFTVSLRSKLKQAMAQMWDAELYLRLAQPKKSLPYQYEALKLIQEIKNSARIYVHRIGFDPPPIKEDKRLSGDLDEVDNVYKREDFDHADAYAGMCESVAILEKRIANDGLILVGDTSAFAKAGDELAALAIKEPSKHLATLQYLKWLTEDKPQPIEVLQAVQQGLLKALPKEKSQPTLRARYQGDLQNLVLKELQAGD